MTFLREHCKPRLNPSPKLLALELSRTKMSFASLTADEDSYVQVAGGPGLFMLERQAAGSERYQAFQDTPVAPHPDGTTLDSSAGSMPMAQSDWSMLNQVIDAFVVFSERNKWPEFVRWKPVQIGV